MLVRGLPQIADSVARVGQYVIYRGDAFASTEG
jgi:hypothetical protein